MWILSPLVSLLQTSTLDISSVFTHVCTADFADCFGIAGHREFNPSKEKKARQQKPSRTVAESQGLLSTAMGKEVTAEYLATDLLSSLQL